MSSSTPTYMTNVFTDQLKNFSRRYRKNCVGSKVEGLIAQNNTRGIFELPRSQSSLIDKDGFLSFSIQFNSIQFN